MHKNIFIGTKSLYVNKIEAMEVDGVWAFEAHRHY